LQARIRGRDRKGLFHSVLDLGDGLPQSSSSWPPGAPLTPSPPIVAPTDLDGHPIDDT